MAVGIHGKGACMTGGMDDRGCMAEGGVHGRGACMAGAMHGRVCACQGACIARGGVHHRGHGC